MATLQEINDIIAAIQFRPPPPVEPEFVNSLLPLTFDQAVNAVQADGYTQNVVNPVIREYQAAFGTVPDQAGLQFWVQQFGTGQVSLSDLSFTFASSQQFFNTYGVGPTAPPTVGLITALYENVLERAPDQAGLDFWLASGLNASQLLEEFAQSGEFIQNTNPNIIAFQNAEVAGNPPVPPTSLFDVDNLDFRLTTAPDTITTAVDNAVFDAAPATNALGLSNTLNAGDNLTDTGANGTLDYTAVASPLGNPALATGVTMTGIENANILNTNIFGVAGFSGNIAGLLNVSLEAGSTGGVLLGLPGAGLATALETVSVNASEDFTAWIASAALAGADDALQLNLNNTSDDFDFFSFIELNVTSGTNAYEVVNLTSSGPTTNRIDLDSNGTTTALITASGDQDLEVFGGLLNRATLDTFDGSLSTGDLTAGFFGAGSVDAFGGSGDDEFIFFSADGTASFGPNDLVDGNAGDDTLTIEAYNSTGSRTLLNAGVGANIVDTENIAHFGVVGNDPGDVLNVNWSRSGSATNLLLQGEYNGDVDITNFTSADTVVLQSDLVDDMRVSFVGAAIFNLEIGREIDPDFPDTDGVVLGTSPGTFGVDFAGTTFNVLSTGDVSASPNQITNVAFADANIINITGAADLNMGNNGGIGAQDGPAIGTAAAQFTSFFWGYDVFGGVVQADTFTGDLVFVAGEGDQTILSGSGDDFLRGGDGRDVFTGDGGSDTFYLFNITEAQGFFYSGFNIDPSQIDWIQDFSVGEDTIGLNNVNLVNFDENTVANVTHVNLGSVTDINDLLADVTTAVGPTNASTNATASIYDVSVNSGAFAGHFLIVNDQVAALSAAGDMIINVTGTNGDLTANDFQFWA